MWIAPTERDTAATTLETRFWHSAAPFRLNSGLKAREHSGPILRILHFAPDARFDFLFRSTATPPPFSA